MQEINNIISDCQEAIPVDRHYFTIVETSRLCNVKPSVLRYWEQEFPQIRNIKKRGNRRYFTREQVLMIQKIRGLLYNQGYTIPNIKATMNQETQPSKVTNVSQVQQLKKTLGEVLHLLR